MGRVYTDPPKKYYLFKGISAVFLGTALGLYFGQNERTEIPSSGDLKENKVSVITVPFKPLDATKPIPQIYAQAVNKRSDPETCYALRKSETYLRDSQNTGLSAVERYDAFKNFAMSEFFAPERAKASHYSLEQIKELMMYHSLQAIPALTHTMDSKITMVEKFLALKRLIEAFDVYESAQDPSASVMRLFGVKSNSSDYMKQMTGWSREELKNLQDSLKDAMIDEVVSIIKNSDKKYISPFDNDSDYDLKKIALLDSLNWEVELKKTDPGPSGQSMAEIFKELKMDPGEVLRFFDAVKVVKSERALATKDKEKHLAMTPC